MVQEMQETNVKKNALYNILKTCSTILFPLITFPYVSRVLQPSNLGKIDFAQSIISYFSLIATLGITTYAVRECSTRRGNQEELNKKASQIYSINICTTIIAYALLFVTMLLFRKLDSYRELILIHSTIILMTTIGADWINTAMEDFKYITIRTFAFQIVSLVLMFLFVRKEADYINYAIITVISSAGANIFNAFYRRKYCKISIMKHMELRKNLPPIMILFVMILAQSVFNNADKTMLGFYKTDYDVGIYGTAVKVTNLLGQLVTSILWVIMPKMSIYFENKDYDNINRMLKSILGFTIVLGLPSVVGVTILSPEIISVIAGEGYEGAIIVLQVLMVALLFRFFGGCFIGNTIMLPTKQEKDFMQACIISTGVNVVLNVFFIQKFGAVGAAITTALSELIILLILLPRIDKKIVIHEKRKMFISPLIGCLSIICVCLLLKKLIYNVYACLFCCIMCSAIVYLIILLLLKNEFAIDVIQTLRKKYIRR